MIPTFAGTPSDAARLAPSPVYLSGEEAIRITSVCNTAGVTVQVNARILRPDNTRSPLQFSHQPNSNRTSATQQAALSEGWLLGFDVRVTSGSPPGQGVWILVELVSGQGATAIPLQALAWDFVSTNNPLMWPGGPNVEPLDGAGALRLVSGTTPGAGVNVVETVPTNARWELLAFYVALTTSAAVANRIVQLGIDDGANAYVWATSGQNHAASAAVIYSWWPGANVLTLAAQSEIIQPLPIGLRLPAGHRMITNTVNIQAGDQFSQVRYLVREWFDV
jgi:hypothetical protein